MISALAGLRFPISGGSLLTALRLTVRLCAIWHRKQRQRRWSNVSLAWARISRLLVLPKASRPPGSVIFFRHIIVPKCKATSLAVPCPHPASPRFCFRPSVHRPELATTAGQENIRRSFPRPKHQHLLQPLLRKESGSSNRKGGSVAT